MSKIYQPRYELTPIIVSGLEEAARFQGQLEGLSIEPQREAEIQSLANVDAVHFSTKIEGNRLTLKEVTRALTGKVKKAATGGRDLREVLNYSRARKILWEKASRREEVTLKTALEIHDVLLSGIVRGRLKGHFRDAQNAVRESLSGALVYMPPVPQDVAPLMNALVQWLRREALDKTSPLLTAPVFHYAFVTIHPFMDGNGRMARLFANHLLDLGGYTVGRYAAIEKQHEADRPRYYEELHRLQRGNFYDIPEELSLSSWIEYWLGALKKTCEEALARVGKKSPALSGKEAEFSPRMEKAVSLFQKYKTLRAADYEALMGIGRTQAVADLDGLIGSGRIARIGGGRSTRYQVKQ